MNKRKSNQTDDEEFQGEKEFQEDEEIQDCVEFDVDSNLEESDVKESDIEEFNEEDSSSNRGDSESVNSKIVQKIKNFEKEKKKHREAFEKISFDISDLDEKHQELPAIIGIEAYKKLVFYFGSQYIYIPQYKKLVDKKRKKYVYDLFISKGADYQTTATLCGISVSTVRRYVRDYKRSSYEKNKKAKKKIKKK